MGLVTVPNWELSFWLVGFVHWLLQHSAVGAFYLIVYNPQRGISVVLITSALFKCHVCLDGEMEANSMPKPKACAN